MIQFKVPHKCLPTDPQITYKHAVSFILLLFCKPKFYFKSPILCFYPLKICST